MTSKYSDYLLSPAWAVRREACLSAAGNKCEGCGFAKRLHIHHLTYERIYDELAGDLMALCMMCHEKAERAIDALQIPRKGDTAQLRALTKAVLATPKHDAPARPGTKDSVRPVARERGKPRDGGVGPRNPTQAAMMGERDFLLSLSLERPVFARWARVRFARDGALIGNALALYDRIKRHGTVTTS